MDRQSEILDFIKTFIAENGYAPTVREIAKGVYLSSTSNVHRYLTALEKSGKIVREATKPRTLKVIA